MNKGFLYKKRHWGNFGSYFYWNWKEKRKIL